MSRTLGTSGSRCPTSIKSDTFMESSTIGGEMDTLGHNHAKKENTYKLEPGVTLQSKTVEEVVEKIMNDYLSDLTYDHQEVKLMSQQLSNKVLEGVKKLGFNRYKFVVSVNIGSLKEQATVHFGSRCLWNKDTDRFVTVKYSNKSLFAVSMIYGLYFD